MEREALEVYLRRQAAFVEAALEKVLPPQETMPERLHAAMRYSLFAGGKRLRPILVLEANRAVGGDPSQALPTACALELIHTYSLIHDDLPCMDNDDLRRGVPTCHRAFDEATALLAGDALLTRAFGLIAETQGVPPEVLLQVIREVSEAAGSLGMVGGQMLDLQAEGKVPTEEMVRAIHLRKTGAMIRVAVRCGGLLGGAPAGDLEALTRYGEAVGLAFQIVDDILDQEGDARKLGKPVRGDEARQKATYPRAVGLEEARRRALALARQAQEILAPWGERGRILQALAEFMVARKF